MHVGMYTSRVRSSKRVEILLADNHASRRTHCHIEQNKRGKREKMDYLTHFFIVGLLPYADNYNFK